MPRVLVIGLDAACFNILLPLVEKGLMPNLAGFLAESTYAEMKSTFPPVTSPAWPSMATGLNPGKLGMFGFYNKKENSQWEFHLVSNNYSNKAIWGLASKENLKCIVCGVPVTYPPVPIEGLMVTDMLTPKDGQYTYPKELMIELKSKDLLINWEEKIDAEQVAAFVDEEGSLFLHLMRNFEWDFAMTVFRSTDAIFHKDPDPRQIELVFTNIDRYLGEILSLANSNDFVFIVSDHGMSSIREMINVNSLLQAEGLLHMLRVNEDIKDNLHLILQRISSSFLFRNGIFRNNLTRDLRRYLSAHYMGRRMDSNQDGPSGSKNLRRLSKKLIDWSRTKCVFTSIGEGCGIYINLKGREPMGIVKPDEYDKVRSEIISVLSKYDNLVVMKREEVYNGKHATKAPDLLLWVDDETITTDARFIDRPVRQEFASYNHKMNGVFIAHGPGIQRNKKIDMLNIYDFMPTVLHILGIPIPEDVDGIVHKEIFDKNSEYYRRELKFQPPIEDEVEEYTDTERVEIEKRLSDLGYL